MDCEKFDTVTMDLLYGELDELSEAAALRHLHHCTRCRDIWGHLRTTRELADIPLDEPPADLFESIISAERNATKTLPFRERASRVISIMAEYAMRPQLAMAALLLLMIGSSLIFVRTGPTDRGQISVTELGTPTSEGVVRTEAGKEALVFEGDPAASARLSDVAAHLSDGSKGNAPGKAEEESSGSAKQSPGSLSQTYRDAMTAYQEGRYAEAERLFSDVASEDDERAASAALHEGHAARNGSGCQRAAALYDAVAERFQGGTVGDEASWHAATCYRAMGQLKRAAAHYTRLKARPAYASRAEKALTEIDAMMVAAASTEQAASGPTTEGAATATPAATKATPPADAPAASDAAPPAPAVNSKNTTIPKTTDLSP